MTDPESCFFRSIGERLRTHQNGFPPRDFSCNQRPGLVSALSSAGDRATGLIAPPPILLSKVPEAAPLPIEADGAGARGGEVTPVFAGELG